LPDIQREKREEFLKLPGDKDEEEVHSGGEIDKNKDDLEDGLLDHMEIPSY
jgi:hypothetical protein